MRAEWEAHLAELTERYEAVRSGVTDLRRRLAELTATARDADGRVAVTVDHQGRLSRVELDPRAAGEMTAAEAVELVLGASRAAAAEIETRRAGLLASALPGPMADRLSAARDEDGGLDLTKLLTPNGTE